jgi:hypothetical protein
MPINRPKAQVDCNFIEKPLTRHLQIGSCQNGKALQMTDKLVENATTYNMGRPIKAGGSTS